MVSFAKKAKWDSQINHGSLVGGMPNLAPDVAVWPTPSLNYLSSLMKEKENGPYVGSLRWLLSCSCGVNLEPRKNKPYAWKHLCPSQMSAINEETEFFFQTWFRDTTCRLNLKSLYEEVSHPILRIKWDAKSYVRLEINHTISRQIINSTITSVYYITNNKT